MYGFVADTFAKARNEERVFIFDREALAHDEPPRKGITASIVEIDDAFLGAFSEHAKRSHFAVNIGEIDTAQLRKTHTAVQEERDDGKIAGAVFRKGIVFHRFKKSKAFIE